MMGTMQGIQDRISEIGKVCCLATIQHYPLANTRKILNGPWEGRYQHAHTFLRSVASDEKSTSKYMVGIK